MFVVDDGLLALAGERLAAFPGLRFVLGGAGSGKSSVVGSLVAAAGVRAIDMDARIYGSWGDRWDPERHPATLAWLRAPDPLAWQLALDLPRFLAFHAAATTEALDLFALELTEAEVDARATVMVDGGFGSVGVVARAFPTARIAFLAAPPGPAAATWTADPDRRAFLDEVARVTAVDDPVARFLALDAGLSTRMLADARAAGVAVVQRAAGDPVAQSAASVARALGIVPG